MKRLNTSLGIILPPVSLFREDIIKIADTLTQNNGKLRLKTKEFEYDSLDELFSNQEDTLLKLSIDRDEPHISVDFDSLIGVSIYTIRDDLLSKAIFFELKSIIKSKRRFSHSVVSNIAKVSSWIGVICGGVYATQGDWTNTILSIMLIFINFIFSLAKHRSFISRESIGGQKSFWKRNSDQIIVAMISAIAGAVLTLIITLLLPSAKS